MNIDTPLVLPEDARLLAVADLPPALRQQLGGDAEDVALVRTGTRTASRLVDRDGAALLAEFRAPSTIVEAVVRYSAGRGLDARETLGHAFELLRACVNGKLLVAAGSEESRRIAASFAVGEAIGEFEVVRCVQVLEDTELYEARRAGEPAAIKLGRASRAPLMRAALEREAALLDLVEGTAGAPRVLTRGVADGRPWLALSWRAGIAVSAAADALRWDLTRPDWRVRLHALALEVLTAYCELHARGVLHGDVQPNNILADATGRVSVLDFGLARVDRPGHPLACIGGGAVPLFCDPETARALLEPDAPSVVLTPAAEQYRLGALLYLMITGRPYIDPPAERDELYRQIVAEAPPSFVERGFESWPEVEAVLHRALAKRPEQRFPDVAAMRAALAAAAPPTPRTLRPQGSAGALVERCLGELAWDGPLLRDGVPEAPTASFNLGAAGLAYFLLRMSQLRDDPDLLALADAWSTRAVATVGRPTAFYNPAIEMDDVMVQPVSLYHHAPGVWWTHARIAAARGDSATVVRCAAEYLRCADQPCASLDPTLGRPSALLGAALLLGELPADASEPGAALLDFVERESAALLAALAALPAIAACAAQPMLGMAHGWAGALYTALRVAQARGVAPDPALAGRLAQLAALAVPHRDGLTWPGSVTVDGHKAPALDFAAGWCAGSAGHAQLFALAHELFGEARWLEVARAAASFAVIHEDGHSDLCCGLAGRGYAALRLYQGTGEARWLDAAEQLAVRAAASEHASLRPLSLGRGRFGVALLLADIDDPALAAAPLHEAPGTRRFGQVTAAPTRTRHGGPTRPAS